MRTKLTKAEIHAIDSIEERLCKMAKKMEEKDIELHYGNGTVSAQLYCAIAALETILQEF